MANILYPPPRPQSVGEILDLAFRIFGTTLLKCLPYSFVGVLISHLTTAYDLATGQRFVSSALGLQRTHDVRWWLLFILAMLGTVVLSNAVLLRQYALATGHAAATGSELATGLRKAPGLLLIGLMFGLAIFATFVPMILVVGIFVGLSRVGAGAGVGWVVVGSFLMVLVAASWAVARWICAGPAYLLTDRGPLESMSYSWHLTQGNFWRLSAIYAVAVVLIIVLYILSTVIGGLVTMLLAHGDVAVITAASAVVVSLLGALVTPFYSALILAVFGDASVRRQGLDLEQRISAPAPS